METVLRIPTVETERMILRAPQWDDFEAYAAFCADPRAVGVGGPYTREQAYTRLLGLVGQWQIRGYGRWMMTDRETGTPLGVTGIYYPEGWPEPEIGWSVFAEAEGKGYAYEGALRARRYAYETLGWDSIISCVMPDNKRSAALAERLGCKPEGLFHSETFGDLHIWRHPSREALS